MAGTAEIEPSLGLADDLSGHDRRTPTPPGSIETVDSLMGKTRLTAEIRRSEP
jgi:hypothetical protein